MRFRKKPVEIEAVLWNGDYFSERPKWLEEALTRPQHEAGAVFRPDPDSRELIVKTLEGQHVASPGDWVLRGVKGELYPCKPDIFFMTYDRADVA